MVHTVLCAFSPTRTNVVSQADYVMVMKGGQVSDFGPPNKMLDSADSELSLLMEELAETSSEDRGSVSNAAAGGSKGWFVGFVVLDDSSDKRYNNYTTVGIVSISIWQSGFKSRHEL